MYENCEALVLRRVRYSETSYVLTLLTREFGRVDALAKGARRPRSPMLGHFDFLAHEEVTLFRRERSSLDIATAAERFSDFPRLRVDPARFAAGGLVAEILLAACQPGDPCPEVFAAALGALGRLDGGEEPCGALLPGLWDVLQGLGFAPRIDGCCDCGLASPAAAALSPAAGGMLCGECQRRRPADADLPRLNRGDLATLRQLAAGRLRLRVCGGGALLKAFEQYYQYVFSRELRGFGLFARMLRRPPRGAAPAHAAVAARAQGA